MVLIKSSKPISLLKKGDNVKVDNLSLEVDTQYVMIDHGGNTKEMVVELFDSKTDKDYQLRYFSDNVDGTLQFFKLNEIIYKEVEIEKVEW